MVCWFCWEVASFMLQTSSFASSESDAELPYISAACFICNDFPRWRGRYETENYSQFTTRIPNVMASPTGLLAMTLYSPASSGEHLKSRCFMKSLCSPDSSFTQAQRFPVVLINVRQPTSWSPVCSGQTFVEGCNSKVAQAFSEADHSCTCSRTFDMDFNLFRDIFWNIKAN